MRWAVDGRRPRDHASLLMVSRTYIGGQGALGGERAEGASTSRFLVPVGAVKHPRAACCQSCNLASRSRPGRRRARLRMLSERPARRCNRRRARTALGPLAQSGSSLRRHSEVFDSSMTWRSSLETCRSCRVREKGPSRTMPTMNAITPTIIRMTPTALRSTSRTATFKAKVNTAPTAKSRTPSAPTVYLQIHDVRRRGAPLWPGSNAHGEKLHPLSDTPDTSSCTWRRAPSGARGAAFSPEAARPVCGSVLPAPGY
jgi:hypothetical protein